ncbi:hypothetical protein KYC5002_26745 [Archangium violaceum]|uniref:hypothetical protein n=1 Tax=Archangium violaceum TaxID=83451 RepID=UPI002B2EDE04|nr:hypothetical protein KYC5002_26745 [Archangium gephyra]
MLAAIEHHFLTALDAALADTVYLKTGPSTGPSPSMTELVEVFASRLEPSRLEGDSLTEGREPAFLTQVQRWTADGTTSDFEVPADVWGDVIEVQSPPGQPASRGDDYALEGRRVRFFRPPTGEVVAILRGGPARGFQAKQLAEVSLSIVVWGGTIERTDELFGEVLAAALAATVGLGHFEAGLPANSGVRLRLLRPVAALTGITRGREKLGRKQLVCASAKLLLRGELEQTVALGTAEAQGLIEKIEYSRTP